MGSARVSWRRTLVRPVLGDGVLASVLAALAVGEALRGGAWPEPAWGSAVLAGLAAGGLVFRRVQPLVSYTVVVGALTTVSVALGHYETGASVLIALVAAYSVGAHGSSPAYGSALSAVFAVSTGLGQRSDEAVADILWTSVALALPLGVGLTVRRLRRRSAGLEAQAEQLRQEQASLTRALTAAAEDERRRIARELHDIISHGLGLVILHAGVAEHVLDSDPERAKASLRLVRRTGQEAIGEMGTLVGLMREAPLSDLQPQPKLADLDRLVAAAIQTGTDVQILRSGDSGGLPAAVELSAYRVVQEAVTNALKYAPGAPVRIVQRAGAEGLQVEVCNDASSASGQGSGSGHGLAGLRERVAVFGGTFVAGPLPHGGWRVRACFPTVR